MAFVNSLDTPLLQLSAQDNFTLENACAGVHVFGGIGSGKTSGSGKMLAGAYLRGGFGGLVTAVKAEEDCAVMAVPVIPTPFEEKKEVD
jgi:hypothetical protein